MSDTIAYILVKTEPGTATDVALQASALDGVYWASVVTGVYDVVAGVRVSDSEALGDLVIGEIHAITGVTETMTAVLSSYFEDGGKPRGFHGAP